MAETKVSLKLLIDSKANKVLFAEANKQFVGFLLHLLSLPIGTVVKLLTTKSMVGCLGDLYKSVESLSTDYFQNNVNIDQVLRPKAAVNVPLLSLNEAPAATKNFYWCNNCRASNVTDSTGVACPNYNCGRTMASSMTYVAPKCSVGLAAPINGDGGYVRGVVTYMVMDNLEVKPMSTISGITLINKFKVKDVAALVDKEVQVGLTEGLAMLKASLETRSVLSSVFLKTCNI